MTRTAADQARVMYDNLRARGLAFNYRLYGSAGDRVIRVYARNRTKTRTQVIRLGTTLDIDWNLTWSCLRDGDAHCGECAGCGKRKAAFQVVGLG